MKNILITGGAGFIGYYLTKHILKEKDVKIIIIDNLQRGKIDESFNSILLDKRVSFIQGDLTDIKFYEGLDKDFDQIYHLAAINGTKNFYKMPEEVLRINTLSLVYLLEWAKKLDKKPKICFTSSNEAYAGALQFGILPIPTPENVPLIIDDTYNARWSYGSTKALGEMFIIHYSKAYNIPSFIVRPHNFYGPRAGYDHVIPEMSQRIINKENPFIIFGSDETRTFCYIEDAVEAMQMLMDSKATDKIPAETYHIGNTDEITMEELAHKLFSITNFRPKEIEKKHGLIGSVKRRLADISKIQKSTGWLPKTSLEEGLKRAFDWYKENPKKN